MTCDSENKENEFNSALIKRTPKPRNQNTLSYLEQLSKINKETRNTVELSNINEEVNTEIDTEINKENDQIIYDENNQIVNNSQFVKQKKIINIKGLDIDGFILNDKTNDFNL